MNKSTRIEKLLALLGNTGEKKIDSKKKLHKLVYLLQEYDEDFDQDFKFHYYGVFSPSLASDLDIADFEGRVHISESEDQFGYIIELDEGEYPDLNLISDKAKELIEVFEFEEPQLLEVLSTIVYLDRNYYEGNELLFKLHELKPKLIDHYPKAFGFAEEYYGITLD